MNTTTAPHTPHSTRTQGELDPFYERFGRQLPKELREIAQGMSWRTFTHTFAPTPALRIHLAETTPRRGRHNHYEATITTTDTPRRSTTREIMASGPVSACTNILADAGYRIEILSFHQVEIYQATVIFIKTSSNTRTRWAMGFGGDPKQAAAAAMASAAQLLYA